MHQYTLVFKHTFLGKKGEIIGKENTEKSYRVNIWRVHIYFLSSQFESGVPLCHSSWGKDTVNKINKSAS